MKISAWLPLIFLILFFYGSILSGQPNILFGKFAQQEKIRANNVQANCCIPSGFDPNAPNLDLHFETSLLSSNLLLQSINNSPQNRKLVFNGTITIDQDFTFFNSPNIIMGPNAQFIVNPSITFNIINSHLYACSNMWVGIIALPNARVNTSGNTIIEDALKAIEVQENTIEHASVNITATTFNKNETAIYFNGSYGNSDFSSSSITGTNFYLHNPLLSPANSVMSNYGILIARAFNSNAPSLVIGGGAGQNFFKGGANGIQIKESNVKIINAKFLNNRKGILINTLTDATPHHVIIGEPNLGNVFEECIDYGVCIYADNVTISKNWFLKCQAPIVINQSKEQEYNIEGNNLQQARYGINLAYNKDLLVNINFNTISTVANTQVPNPFQGAAIRAYNASPCQEFIIADNYIHSETINAIIANNENTGRLSIMNNIILNNAQASTLPNTTGFSGIKLDACDGALVQCNNLSNSQNITTTANAARLSSNVAISQSLAVTVDCNEFNNSRYGLSYVGLCNQNEFLIKGNDFNALNFGIYLGSSGNLGSTYVEAIIGDQLIDATNLLPSNFFNGINANRQFTTAGIFRRVLAGSSTATTVPKYNYDPSNLVTFTSSLSSPAGSAYRVDMIPLPGDLRECLGCGYYSSSAAIDSNLQSTQQIIEEAAENDNGNLFTDEVIKWLYQKELYKTLLNDSNILDSSAALAAYFEDLENTDLAKMAEVERIEEELRDTITPLDSLTRVLKKQQITYLLDAMAAANVISWNEKRVNGILVDKIEKGLPLTSEEESDIASIAHQCPHITGKAVYKARGIYSTIDPVAWFNDGSLCNVSTGTRQMQNGLDDDVFLKIVPNPASTAIKIYLSENEISMAEVYLFDATGKQVLRKRIQNNDGNNMINVSALNNGLYFCKVEINGSTFYQPLTIIR